MDQASLNAFLVGRALLDRARTIVDGSDADEIGTVILLDTAVETVARAAAREHPPSSFPGQHGYLLKKSQLTQPPREPGLPYVLDQILAAYREKTGDADARVDALTGAAGLHKLRNQAQHAGRAPSASARERARDEAVTLLRWVARELYGQELETISRATLIESSNVRAAVVRAEEQAAAGRYHEACADLWIAFDRARAEFEAVDSTRHDDRHLWVRQAVEAAVGNTSSRNPANSGSGSRLVELLEELEKRLEAHQKQIDLLYLGEDAADYAWFERTCVRPWGNINGVYHLADPVERPSGDDFARAYEFVVRSALRWQRLPVTLDALPPAAREWGETYSEQPYTPPDMPEPNRMFRRSH